MTGADLHELPDSIFKDQRFPGAFFFSNTAKALGLDHTVPPVGAHVKLRKYMYHHVGFAELRSWICGRSWSFLPTQISWSSAQASFFEIGKGRFCDLTHCAAGPPGLC